MKKLLIFISLISVLNAESIFNKAELNRIAEDSAKKVWIEEPKEVKKDIKINLNIGLTTKHIQKNKDYEFVEKNNIVSLELEKEKELIGVCKFTNSFGNESLALYYGKIFDKNNKRLYLKLTSGICKGYNKIDYLPSKTVKNMKWEFVNPTVFYEDFSLMATVGIGYNFNSDIGIECNLIGNAIVTSVKLSY